MVAGQSDYIKTISESKKQHGFRNVFSNAEGSS
jgi:hypothetical protein